MGGWARRAALLVAGAWVVGLSPSKTRGQGGAWAMKLLSKDISKEGGRVKLVPEDAEDLWTVYNLVAKGDSLRADTLRKVTSETSTGTTSSERMRIALTIQVLRPSQGGRSHSDHNASRLLTCMRIALSVQALSPIQPQK